jgi:hypothetical protein
MSMTSAVDIRIHAVSPESIFKIVVPAGAAAAAGEASCAMAASGTRTSMQTNTTRMNPNLPLISESSLLSKILTLPPLDMIAHHISTICLI